MAFKIYTRTGDKGTTGLFGGKRVDKDDIRVEAYGAVDELNAFIGLLRDHLPEGEENTAEVLLAIQHRLFTIGSLLASDPDKDLPKLDLLDSDVQLMETEIDKMDERLPALKNFILPGGHPIVSYAHLARCVCRRAERRVVSLGHHAEVEPMVLHYLNRLSDYLFMLGRYVGFVVSAEEIPWHARK